MAKQTFTTGQVLSATQMTTLQQTAMLGGAANAKTASYTLVAADAGDGITMSNAGATTITVNSGLFAAGDIVTIINLGAGTCTITAGTATVSTAGSLALGTNQGGVLRFTSSSAAIFFQFVAPAAASGGMTQLATGTMTGSATIRLQSIPSTYKFCRLYIKNHIATTTNLSLRFRLNNDSTANRYASGGELSQNYSETFRYDSVYCTSDLSNTTANGMAVFEIHDYTSTGTWKMFSAMAIGNNKTTSTSVQLGSVVGAYNQTGAITEIDIFSDQGNWTGGTYTLYGVN